jgi:hypothetical protein
MPLSTFDNIWLRRLIFRLCPCVVFPSCVTFLEEMLLAMVTKTMQLHVLPGLAKATTLSTSFDL